MAACTKCCQRSTPPTRGRPGCFRIFQEISGRTKPYSSTCSGWRKSWVRGQCKVSQVQPDNAPCFFVSPSVSLFHATTHTLLNIMFTEITEHSQWHKVTYQKI